MVSPLIMRKLQTGKPCLNQNHLLDKTLKSTCTQFPEFMICGRQYNISLLSVLEMKIEKRFCMFCYRTGLQQIKYLLPVGEINEKVFQFLLNVSKFVVK